MFVACYNRRQESRQALALETAIERELEGQPTVGGEIVPPVGHVLLEEMFTPLQRNMTALAANSLKARFPEYAWSNLQRTSKPLLDSNTAWPLGLARFKKPQWMFPISLIDPLIWYWKRLEFYDEPETLEGVHGRGVTWLELAMDFEITTRIPLSRNGPDNATEHMRERAGLMSDISKALLRGLSNPLKHQIAHCRSIQAFRSAVRAGLRFRPALLEPEAVGYELGIQVMLHPGLMGEKHTQWKWRPNHRYLPPVKYAPVFLNERLWSRHKRRLMSKTTLVSVE